MARLGHEDRAGNGEVALGGDERGGTEVGTDTDLLEDGGEGDKVLDAVDRELVLASSDRVGTGGGQAGGQEGNVLSLVLGDLGKALAGPEGVAETGRARSATAPSISDQAMPLTRQPQSPWPSKPKGSAGRSRPRLAHRKWISL